MPMWSRAILVSWASIIWAAYGCPAKTSTTWHHGYGGGLYLVPFDAIMITGHIGWSEEDRIVSASLGAKVNVVFR